MRMLQARDELDLATKPLAAHLTGGLARQHLDDHIAIEAEIAGDEDSRHPAAAELSLDTVGAAEGLLEGVAE